MTRPATFELATTDSLTGLLSADYFRYLLREQVFPEMRQRDESLSVFLLDLDNFQELNEQHGRECGDQALQAVSSILQEIAPDNALLVRYSGDEFGGAFPEMRIDDAFSLLEEVRRRVVALAVPCVEDVHLTCSIGLAGFPNHARDEVELVRHADEAVYAAKIGGRNKVALPMADSRMVTKTSYYTQTQLGRLSELAKSVKRNEATILREALDDVLKKYNDRLKA
ncbi:MAG: diguanylate cyclase [Caldilineaceae bacterium]|nr:diguanylate cyclase [Caldilineaceae bacterium]